MKKSQLTALAVIVAAAALLVWYLLAPAPAASRARSSDLPDVELASLGGQPVRLQQFLGRPLVLNLWATWCPPCRREMPLLVRTATERSDVAFVFASQDRGNAAPLVRSFLDQSGLVMEWVLLDPENALQRELKTTGLPTTYFFDREGRLVAKHVGEISPRILEASLAQIAP
ncbi:MAG TPA: TlpA family protein disulfide reductase [Oceanithermus profundus]|uniref:TlpA family protein disulfide reductase n=1 Tax=Oceanithermus profundus TaxID=187137 RepID=A0A7C4V584_9DEIN|nr:TlpA family protein disulfide reductase [Oceanithermus profundus]